MCQMNPRGYWRTALNLHRNTRHPPKHNYRYMNLYFCWRSSQPLQRRDGVDLLLQMPTTAPRRRPGPCQRPKKACWVSWINKGSSQSFFNLSLDPNLSCRLFLPKILLFLFLFFWFSAFNQLVEKRPKKKRSRKGREAWKTTTKGIMHLFFPFFLYFAGTFMFLID